MTKRRIYMVQPSSQHTNVMPLPYALGVLHAFVYDKAEIMDHFEFQDYIFEKKDLVFTAAAMREPYAVFFSCYIWNHEYNKKLAMEIHRQHPRAVLVFGGHNVPMDFRKAFQELPFADYLILGEGERPFEDLLLFFLGKKPRDELKNIAYRDEAGNALCAMDPGYVTERFVSPYQLGLFDSLWAENKSKYRFSATLETNRGCPFSCGYCDWGLNRVKVRFAEEEQIRGDILWISKHGIEECYGADSNFGMFARDMEFARLLAKVKRQNGYPKTFYVSFSKQSDQRVLEIATILYEAGMLQGATLSFQSLNLDTLSAVGRKNLDLDYFSRMMHAYHLRRIPTYSELILGLPMETKESFQQGIATLMDHGQHSAIDVYECCLLPNSDLGQTDRVRRYGISTMHLPFRRFDVSETEEIQEYSNIIVETSTMSKADWRDCNLFYNTVAALHFGKLFHCAALYLHAALWMSYVQIYSEVLSTWSSLTGTVWQEMVRRITDQLDRISAGMDGWLFQWPEEHFHNASFKTVISKVVLRNYSAFIEQIARQIGRHTDDGPLAEEIAKYQAFCIKARIDRDVARSQEFGYDFRTYFDALYLGQPAELIPKRTTITADEIRASISFE